MCQAGEPRTCISDSPDRMHCGTCVTASLSQHVSHGLSFMRSCSGRSRVCCMRWCCSRSLCLGRRPAILAGRCTASPALGITPVAAVQCSLLRIMLSLSWVSSPAVNGRDGYHRLFYGVSWCDWTYYLWCCFMVCMRQILKPDILANDRQASVGVIGKTQQPDNEPAAHRSTAVCGSRFEGPF